MLCCGHKKERPERGLHLRSSANGVQVPGCISLAASVVALSHSNLFHAIIFSWLRLSCHYLIKEM